MRKVALILALICISVYGLSQSNPPSVLLYTLVNGVLTPATGSGTTLSTNPPPMLCYGLNGSNQPAPCVFSGGSGITALSQDVNASGTGSVAATVTGIETVPFCTGFTPLNGQSIEYTTGSSPNPCYTAATAGGSLPTSVLGQTLQSTGSGTTYAASYSAPFFGNGGITWFGDSISCNFGPGFANEGFTSLIANSYGGTFNNLCRSGDWAADTARVWVFPYINSIYAGGPNFGIAIGTNDGNGCGTSAGCENNYSAIMEAIVSDLSTPNTYKTWGQSCTTTSGTTTSDNTIPGVHALESTTNATVITCVTPVDTVANSKVDVVYRAFGSGNAGTATLTVDGNSEGTLDAYGFNGVNISTTNGTTDTLFGSEYTVAAATSHTVVFTITSATSSSNPFSVVYVSTPYTSSEWTTATPPHLLLAGPVSPTGSTATIYNGLMSAVATQYINDGVVVRYVNTPNFMNNTNDFLQNATNISGRTFTDIVTTAGSKTVTSATANFANSMIGQEFPIDGAGTSGGWEDEEIVAVTNQTTATVSTAAVTSGTGLTAYLGTCTQVVGPNTGTPYYIHPNASGNCHIRDAIYSVAPPLNQSVAYNPTLSGNVTIASTNNGNAGATLAINQTSGTATQPPALVIAQSGGSSYQPLLSLINTDATAYTAAWANGFAPNIFMNINGSGNRPAMIATENGSSTFAFEIDGSLNLIETKSISSYDFTANQSPSNLGSGMVPIQFKDPQASAQQTSWGTYPPVIGLNTHSSSSYNAFQLRHDGSSTDYFTITQAGALTMASVLSSPNVTLTSKCSSAASPAVCGSSTSGLVQVAASGTSLTINTTAVSATSVFNFTYNTAASGCTTPPTNIGSLITPYVSTITAGTSFAITLPVAPLTNSVCINYTIF